MRLKRLAAGLALGSALLAGACATLRIGAYVEHGVDFARYHTYAWAPADTLPIGDPRLDNNPIFVDYLQGSVERHLRGHGLMLVPASANPDLLIHFHGSVRQRIEPTENDHERAYRVGDEPPLVYEEGTLVLDLMDARTDRLVWRGWAIDTLDGIIGSQDRMERTIDEAVTEMIANLKAR
ncbi:MAG TPA: DUF4136 domain-containing protein [Vicinamibacterales bacterium]|jgi:hypothetical protein|nr:DUF4136 domain-containing protein [Vicinamibacterales bacterium]